MCDTKTKTGTAPCRDIVIIDQIAEYFERLLKKDEDES